MADIFLAREQEFEYHAAHILQFDRYLGLLAESCLLSPRLATTVREFEVGTQVFRDPALRMLWGPDRGTWKNLREGLSWAADRETQWGDWKGHPTGGEPRTE